MGQRVPEPVPMAPGDKVTYHGGTIHASQYGTFYPQSTTFIPTDPPWYEAKVTVDPLPKTKLEPDSEIICHCKKCHTKMIITKIFSHADGFKMAVLKCPEKSFWNRGHEEAVYNSYSGDRFSRVR